ncbi:MAG: metallothionein [Oscillatoria sp. PMC 1068.18]|nr:metallothionein [Oscillatoria sp. PMC 1076.18]MEC4989277.1 metallothionein [Oscillatoria sp. PMC 1068.18]
MATATSMKCACESCKCVVSLEEAIQKNGKYYCCENCANGHPEGKACKHHDCECG